MLFGYEIDVSKPITYEYTGKFQATTAEWTHERMPLINYELIVMTEGPLYLSYAGKDYTVKEGEYLLIPPFYPYLFREGFKSSYCSFYWMHFSTSEKDSVCVDLGALNEAEKENKLIIPAMGRLYNPKKVVVLMKQLQDFICSGYDKVSNNYLATTILCEVYNQTVREGIHLLQSDKKKKQLYYDMVDYIDKNLFRNLKVSDVADYFGYNSEYLSHMFSSLKGITLKRFILQKKVEKANYLLMDTNKTINEISIILGFSDCHNFMKVYKRITGLTPSEYRNAYARRMLFHK